MNYFGLTPKLKLGVLGVVRKLVKKINLAMVTIFGKKRIPLLTSCPNNKPSKFGFTRFKRLIPKILWFFLPNSVVGKSISQKIKT
jgi:hypothetical protein